MRIQCVECKNAAELNCDWKFLDVCCMFFEGSCDCLFDECEKFVEMLMLLLLIK